MTALIVEPDDLGRRAGFPDPLSADDRNRLTAAIEDAQADVEAYLGRFITPTQVVDTGLWPNPNGWLLSSTDPILSVISAVPEVDENQAPTGTFTVTYLTGLDAANDPTLRPIRRYVAVHAMLMPDVQQALPVGRRAVTSVSVDGQSITYANSAGAAGSNLPGALPAMSSLSRWRLAGRRVYQRVDPPLPDWCPSDPYTYDPYDPSTWAQGGW